MLKIVGKVQQLALEGYWTMEEEEEARLGH